MISSAFSFCYFAVKPRIRAGWELLIRAYTKFDDDQGSIWAASLAFYSMLSITPLMFLTVSIAGAVVGRDAASDALLHQLGSLLGDEPARALAKMMEEASQPGRGLWATLFGLGTLTFGASGVFSALQDAMDAVWHVRTRPDAGLVVLVKRRFVSIAMVLGLGFLLMISVGFSSFLALSSEWWQPGQAKIGIAVEQVFSFLTDFALLAAIFRVLPDAKVDWRNTMSGAALTSVALSLGKAAIGAYLGRSEVAAPFGGAGSLVIVLLWIYYAAQILLFGAELTRAHAEQAGQRIEPDNDAVSVATVIDKG